MRTIIHKTELSSGSRHLVVLGTIDSDWSMIGLSKDEHNFVTSRLELGEFSIHINQYSRSIFIETFQEGAIKSNNLEKAREIGAKLVKQCNEDKIEEEIKTQLNELLEKLREAHKSENLDLVNQYTEELNQLWGKASQKMYQNMQEDGVETPPKDPSVEEAEYEEVK